MTSCSEVGTRIGGEGRAANPNQKGPTGLIAFALKQAEVGTSVEEVCRKMGISDATFYNWRKKYGGLGPSELRRLKQLEEENAKLKRLVADLTLDKHILQEVLRKKP
mgnify:CR=1 FL=1